MVALLTVFGEERRIEQGCKNLESRRDSKLLQPGGGLMQVNSTVKMNMPRIRQLTQAAVTALEQTGEALHTEVVQAPGIPV